MCASEEFTAQRGRGAGTDFGDVVDEIACDGDLCACIAELREGSVEETVLAVEGFLGGGGGGGGLEGHVCVGDFGDRGEVEYYSEEEDETGDGEIDPLHVLEGLRRVGGV